ncbi:HAD-like protein [Calocera cornea HHB12733]|uniref:HAD-like protein n=1 Tax=Calocera cornea HHB12733 TaxID=1353952 RepID=A0A165FTQ0_9BASI|nr:HAD-like protein [Calocera cornea HHB12733]
MSQGQGQGRGQEYKGVLFDIGGVLLASPLTVIQGYSRSLGLPGDYLNVLITALGHDSAWARFERGELDLWSFYTVWGDELSDTTRGRVAYSAWARKRGREPEEVPQRVRVDARELFGMMMRQAGTYDPYILQAVKSLRRLGKHRVVAVTNNYTAAYDEVLSAALSGDVRSQQEIDFLGWSHGPAPPSMRALFDDFVDSSEAGVRKPERAIFDIALARNGLKARECVFLDDIGENLKTVRGLGVRTVQVKVGGTREAVRELEEILGMRLLDEDGEGAKARL